MVNLIIYSHFCDVLNVVHGPQNIVPYLCKGYGIEPLDWLERLAYTKEIFATQRDGGRPEEWGGPRVNTLR